MEVVSCANGVLYKQFTYTSEDKPKSIYTGDSGTSEELK